MGKVQIKISPSPLVMTSLGKGGEWLTLSRPIKGNSTIGKVLRSLTKEYSEFTTMISNKDTDNITDDINVVLNQTMLLTSKAYNVKLKDGDTVTLLPVYTGG